MSIAKFPIFSPLHVDFRDELAAFARHYPPYSDFSFTNLYVYDAMGTTRRSLLDDHLIVETPDLIHGCSAYTFLGPRNGRHITDAIFDWATANNAPVRLSCVPEVSIVLPDNPANGYRAVPQRDSFDYLYNIDDIIRLPSSAYAHKRQKTNQFRRNHARHSVRTIDVSDPSIRMAVDEILERWRIEKARSHEQVASEFTALYRCFEEQICDNIVGVGIFIDDQLIGFSFSEVVHDGYCIVHFIKAIPAYKGLAEVLMHETARTMAQLGCVYLNLQDDAGIHGLRNSKLSWQPVTFLHKFELHRDGYEAQ